jgi:hypothetical protein
MFYLYSEWAFLAAKSKRAILCACAILCAIGDHISEQYRGFLMILINIFFLRTPSGNGNVDRGLRDLLESGFKVSKNLPPAKKIAGEIWITNFNYFFWT